MQSKAVICDPGTGYMKMGFAGDNFPQAAFASLVGRPMLRFEESLGEEVQLKVSMEIVIGSNGGQRSIKVQSFAGADISDLLGYRQELGRHVNLAEILFRPDRYDRP